jgi:hypothetical protein
LIFNKKNDIIYIVKEKEIYQWILIRNIF